MFVEKLYKNRIDSSELLDCFPIYAAPKSTRKTDRTRGVINVPYPMVETVRRSTFVRAPIHVNDILFACKESIDLYAIDRSYFYRFVIEQNM